MPLPFMTRPPVARRTMAVVGATAFVAAAAVAFLIGPPPESSSTSLDAVEASGAATLEVLDPVHDRPFELSVWAPASDANGTLVVISHGFSGDRTSHDDLAAMLAASGFTVAAPTHPDMAGLGSNDARLDPLALRPRHLSLTIDHLMQGEPFDRVVVIGHSIGGYSALRAAGATVSFADLSDPALFNHCAANAGDEVLCNPAAQSRFEQLVDEAPADPRIDAIVLMAPAYGPLFEADDLEQIGADVLVINAETDDQLPGGQVQALAQSLPNAESVTVAGGHYVFLRPCTDAETSVLPELCVDAPSVDRVAVHAEIATAIDSFLGPRP